MSPTQCKSQSFLWALFVARVCAVFTLLPKEHYFPFDVSQNEAINGEIFG
jgi:hypothetical protein